LIVAFLVFNPGDLYYLGYKKIIIINVSLLVHRLKVVTSEALGPGSVLLIQGKRESPGEEDCLQTAGAEHR